MIDFSLKSSHWSQPRASHPALPYSSYNTVHQPYCIWVWLTALKVSDILAFLLDILAFPKSILINGWSSVMNPQPEERKHCWSTSCFTPHVATLDNSHSGLFGHFHQWIASRKKNGQEPSLLYWKIMESQWFPVALEPICWFFELSDCQVPSSKFT